MCIRDSCKEGLHDNQCNDRIKDFVFADIIQFEDDESLIQQVQLLVRVQEVVVLPATIVRFENVQKIFNIEILFPDALFFQQTAVIRCDELVEGVERRCDRSAGLELREV